MWEAIKEVVRYRELLVELALRDIRIRYKQTLLGVAWALFLPVLMMIIFTQVFTRVARIETGGIPYPIFVYCGLLPWQFFASSLKGSVESLTRNRQLVTKIYMPREVFPIAQVIASGVDFLVASSVLVVLMAWYGCPLRMTALLLPVLLATQVALTIGLGLLLSMGNLFYRDVKYVFEVVLLLWMFVSSVVYPVPADLPGAWFLALNPMTPILDGYRQLLLHGQLPDPLMFGYVAAVSLGTLVLGLRWFHHTEYLFAESI